MSANDFTQLADLAGARVGGKVLAANDEFFAPKENLIKAGRAIFIADKFTRFGKWMDGWETRRRREPGHDWCILRLGLRGIIRGVVVDTSHFIGNQPERCSIEACDAPGAKLADLIGNKVAWNEILAASPLRPGSDNLFEIRDNQPRTHARLNIYPDGGVARLRLHGDVAVDWSRAKNGKTIDLAALVNGGLALGASDMHFGSKDNLILPGPARNMGEGWETRRRRGPGHDWCVLRLGAPGRLEKIEVDTSHFIGNYPESCSLDGCRAPGASFESLEGYGASWSEILPRTKLSPDHRHVFTVKPPSAALTHVRLNIFPDGGVARLRLYGKVATP